MISRAHNIDTNMFGDSEEVKLLSHKVTTRLGYLTRVRRIAIGKKLWELAEKARDGATYIFVHLQRPIGQIYIYVFTSAGHKDRHQYLEAICAAAQVKYGYEKVFGVITEPIGSGRSYDFVFLEQRLIPSDVQVPKEILDQLQGLKTEMSI